MNNYLFSTPFRTGLRVASLVVMLFVTLGPGSVSPVYAAPPSNDTFGSAINISIPYMQTVSTVDAAVAGDGPQVPVACDGRLLDKGERNVWYRYVPGATNKLVHLDTHGSLNTNNDSYDTYIAVWRGTSINGLTYVACDDDVDEGYTSQLSFTAQAGSTYYIEVASYAGTTASPNQPGETGTLVIHVSTFADIPSSYWAWRFIEGLYAAGVTSGCTNSPLSYCPTTTVTRDQMAVFILRGKHGATYNPPPVGATTGFADVPTTYWAAAWIKQLAAEGITGGCTSTNYCPGSPVTRDQMAVFLLRAKYGSGYSPPAVGASTGFADVPPTYWAAGWIKQLAAEGITGGCSAGLYCPLTPVSRDQMAVFLTRTFNLPPKP